MANVRQQIGMFTLYPAIGVVPPSGCIQISVDMLGENPGYSEEVSLVIRSVMQNKEHKVLCMP